MRTPRGRIGLGAGCRALAAASVLQLTAGALGMAVAVQRRLPYDVRLVGMSGRPDTVVRDSVFLGTALSAPVTMLSAQALVTGLVATGRARPWAIPTLGVLGAAMVGGYLGETLVRQRLRPVGWETVESSIVIGGISLAALMAILSARCLTRPGQPGRVSSPVA